MLLLFMQRDTGCNVALVEILMKNKTFLNGNIKQARRSVAYRSSFCAGFTGQQGKHTGMWKHSSAFKLPNLPSLD